MRYLESVLGKDNSFWKYVIVILVTMIASQLIGGIFIGIVIGVFVFLSISNEGGSFSPETFSNVKNLYDLGLPENLVLILMLFPFVVGMITLWLLINRMHKRTFSMTVNGGESVRWSHVFVGFSVWFLLMFVFFAVNYIVDPDNFKVQFNISEFIPLLVISLLFIPIQTTYEEYMFRGYLAQGIAAWTKNRWLVICIPGLLFGLMHFANTEVSEHGFWVVMPQYIIFGLFFGFVAVMDDGIELPIGMHAANNLFACLFVTNEASSLRTPAIFNQETIFHLSETVGLLIAALLAALFFYRKYKWNLNIINEKIAISNHAEQII
ncbi:MAG: CPBP family intramembrane metalloprotease [Prevotellaceae bacterium]|jgi:membrane protease YdiL (CAAX protease family)|nr:CPBP family intramembrane metalloprotease [Prevotellaceae bacterium]